MSSCLCELTDVQRCRPRLLRADGSEQAGVCRGDCGRAETGRRAISLKIAWSMSARAASRDIAVRFSGDIVTAVVSTCSQEMLRQSTLLADCDWPGRRGERHAGRCVRNGSAGGLLQCRTGWPEWFVAGFGYTRPFPFLCRPLADRLLLRSTPEGVRLGKNSAKFDFGSSCGRLAHSRPQSVKARPLFGGK